MNLKILVQMKKVISLVVLFLVQFINAQEATIGEINNVKKNRFTTGFAFS